MEKELESIKIIVLKHYTSGHFTVGQVIDYFNHTVKKFTEKPKKPVLLNKDNPKELREFADKVEKYESDFNKWEEAVKANSEFNKKIDEFIVDFIKKESELNSVVPEQYRNKVYLYAYNMGHSNGYNEVFNGLCGLVEIFR